MIDITNNKKDHHWKELEEYIPGAIKVIEQIIFNLKMLDHDDITFKYRSRREETKYTFYKRNAPLVVITIDKVYNNTHLEFNFFNDVELMNVFLTHWASRL